MRVVKIGTCYDEGSVFPDGQVVTATWPGGLHWDAVLPRTAVQWLVVFGRPSQRHYTVYPKSEELGS